METIFAKESLAVITGGASGIGLALAKRCSAAGMRVVVVDKNKTAIDAVNDQFQEKIRGIEFDVSKPEEWAGLKAIIDRDHSGAIGLLALNAGMRSGSSWGDEPSFETTFKTNVFGVVEGVKTCLSGLRKNAEAGNRSAVIITGSKQGITNPPGYPAYNASKAAVKSIAEQLSFDLRDEANISVHLLIPGWTFTGMTGSGQEADAAKPDGAWWPDQVVDFLEKRIADNQFWVICPDNDVTEHMDRQRMLWGLGDAIEGRQPLSRWRPEWAEESARFFGK